MFKITWLSRQKHSLWKVLKSISIWLFWSVPAIKIEKNCGLTIYMQIHLPVSMCSHNKRPAFDQGGFQIRVLRSFHLTLTYKRSEPPFSTFYLFSYALSFILSWLRYICFHLRRVLTHGNESCWCMMFTRFRVHELSLISVFLMEKIDFGLSFLHLIYLFTFHSYLLLSSEVSSNSPELWPTWIIWLSELRSDISWYSSLVTLYLQIKVIIMRNSTGFWWSRLWF